MKSAHRYPAGALGAIALVLCLGGVAQAQAPSGAALVESLRAGGHVIYFRHAATQWDRQDHVGTSGDWRSCDPARMRQLSDAGRRAAAEIGAAIRALRIPVAEVLSSEYCRTAETARLLDIGTVETTTDIMNLRAAEYVGGRDAAVARARRVIATPPPSGANVVIVAHGNLMQGATGSYVGEAGSAIYVPAPDSEHGFEFVTHLKAEDWSRLAARFAASAN